MAVGTGFEPILALGEVKDTTMTGCQSVAGLTKTRELFMLTFTSTANL